ncbi:sodium/hydrogen exchanger [Ammonifex degensii KC4]|uniref:Sodium/hydrogen exchanger n=1 Tax=Ammonifex degensii (strain DSM 10501 / KC4) TaxID=429009 RepID=C9R7N9_AMMDK|nr:cation:proton antiporter [Ammonifex degensii]ACX52318.1 sodium/hydrogen exchanger [Ammonifex degensii KC4]
MPEVGFGGLVILFLGVSVAILLARRTRFCSIPLLIFLGAFLGPHAPQTTFINLRLLEPTESMALMAKLGLIFLLFHLGLEFSVTRLLEKVPVLAKSGSLYVGLNFLRGLLLGWLLFRSGLDSWAIAGITAFSSSAIVARLLVELKRTANPETEYILGLLVWEDIFVALYLAFFSALLFSPPEGRWLRLLGGVLAAAGILAILLGGRKLKPCLDRLLDLKHGESVLVTTFALLLLTVYLCSRVGIAEGVGALVLGMILAETRHAKLLVSLFAPLKDLLGGVFFFVVGMGIDYRHFLPATDKAVLAALVTVLGNLVVGWLSAYLAGYRGRAAFNVGATMMARGEFAIIIAGLAVEGGASSLLEPVAALYVFLLALVSPLLARHSRRIYSFLSKVPALFGRA